MSPFLPLPSLQGTTLSAQGSIDLLGMKICCDLNSRNYIETVIKTASRKLGVLNKVRRCFTPDQLFLLYKTQVRSCVEYFSHLWDGSAKYLLDALDRLQRRAVRISGDVEVTNNLEPPQLRKDIASLRTLYWIIDVKKCLMPGTDSRVKPPLATDSSASEEASQLELYLQRQLEEDIARIFDESIYSDVEVVCGKLKILTHSCILKARTNKFYHKLETILHVKIARSTFDEIYSFISDTYTECNIKHQEKEILNYLKHSLETKEEVDEFLTPTCESPYIDKNIKKSNSSSPSKELTKEYYALVPIEGNLLEKELIEQDELSNAFHSIINSQIGDLEKFKSLQHNKPTSLTLLSSHSSKSLEHSNSCDILIKNSNRNNNLNEIYKFEENKTESSRKIINKQIVELNDSNDLILNKIKSCELVSDSNIETAYSPDSLITDDLSSASDYLSAAYTCSARVGSVGHTRVIVHDNITKMDNLFTSLDSGLENTGLLESLTSHKDVTLTDMSLTESALHDFTTDDGSNSYASASNSNGENRPSLSTNPENFATARTAAKVSPENNSQITNLPVKHGEITNCNSSKEEKQRQNEEIVILESSSLSSETGSWESVFPPKLAPKDICEKFINNERLHYNDINAKEKGKSSIYRDICPSVLKKSSLKSTSCFIDAASLIDVEDDIIKINVQHNEQSEVSNLKVNLVAPSKPVPCSTHKSDLSPNDWSENDNEDSLDTDSIQKDLSPTIFEMTPIPEDSVFANTFKPYQESNNKQPATAEEITSSNIIRDYSSSSSSVFMTSTPHNSILSLKASTQYEPDKSKSDIFIKSHEEQMAIKQLTKNQELESNSKSPQPSCWSSWVVNMSPISKPESEKVKCESIDIIQRRPIDKMCGNLRNYSKHGGSLENCSKSRSSVDSDSSERSSHKFYVDLSSLPDPESPKHQTESECANEKKHMFSMFIGFGEKSTLKEIPTRLTSLNTKKTVTTETKPTPPKNQKTKSANECSTILTHKNIETSSPSIFEIYEGLCEDPKISISEIINLRQKCHKESLIDTKYEPTKNHNIQSKSLSSGHSAHSSLRPIIQKEELNGQDDALFVKLSDLDKPVLKTDTPVGKDERRILDERMTRSIPENNWSDQNQAVSLRSNEVISSFHSENALSLNRLFPHLRNEFSRSMPGSLSSRTRSPLRLDAFSSPGDVDDQTSETSDMSSVQSSFCRSIVENSTTEETSQASSLIGNCQSRLGQDLLRMFLEEIAPDVIVEVSGRRIKAHKCILSSRCQYFAGILSGGWVESAGNVISLPTFSFNVVHFALCHIYSGVSTIPDSISIVELATLADMLGLEGLKEAIMFTLKAKYCHHFHRPCAVCKAGVLECFPLTSVYGLDDLYRKCLKWITKYFSLVWPTKAFATLPSELLEKCYQQVVIDLSLENCIETAYGCGFAVSVLNRSRWADVVAQMCHRVARATANFMAPKLVTVLRNIEMQPPDRPYSAIQALDECIRAAIAWAPPDELCRAYGFIADIVKEIRNFRFTKPDLITNGNIPGRDSLLYSQANAWLLLCEKSIIKDATRVCCTQAYIDLPSDSRKRLQELGCIKRPTLTPGQSPVPLNKRTRYHRKSSKTDNSTWPSKTTSNDLDIDQMRVSFVPYSLKPPPQDHVHNNLILQELKKTSRFTPPKVRTTKAQEERAKFNLTKTTLSQERLNIKTVKPYEKAKPRYLDKKKVVPKLLSSSQTSIQSQRSNSVKIRHVDETQTQDCVAGPRLATETQASLRSNLVASSRSRVKTKTEALSKDSSVIPTQPRTEPHEQDLSHDSRATSRQRMDIQAIAQEGLVMSSRSRSEAQAQVLPQDISTLRHETQALSEISIKSSSRSRPKVRAQNLSHHNLMTSSRHCTESVVQASQDSLATSSRPCDEASSHVGLTSSQRSDPQEQILPKDSLSTQSRPCIEVQATSNDHLTTSSRFCVKANAQTLSQDSLATSSRPHTAEPSTDSLSESQNSNKYATYTKMKHTSKGLTDSRKNTPDHSRIVNQKVKSKIPVYLTQTSKAPNLNQSPTQSRRSHTPNTSATTSTTTSSVQSRSKIHDRSSSCSLMNATKSSSAKMVTKVMKETTRAKRATKNNNTSQRRTENEPPVDIPVMERSGTFLKDEPTFGRSDLFDTDDTD